MTSRTLLRKLCNAIVSFNGYPALPEKNALDFNRLVNTNIIVILSSTVYESVFSISTYLYYSYSG